MTREPDGITWFFALIFTIGGLFSGYISGGWDGVGQAFIGEMAAFLLGMCVHSKWPDRVKGERGA